MRTHLILSLIAVAILVAAAHAQPGPELLWSAAGNGSLQAITAVPDISGDGRPDIVFEGYENGPTGVNHVFAIRGASSGAGTVLWSARPIGGASSGGGWGDNCLRLGSDLNHDGTPDLLLGTAWGGRTAYALNSTSGATLWGYDTYAHYGSDGSGWIYAMDDLGSDLTGDGVREVVFCSGSYNDRVHCVNGATGAQIWVVPGGDAYFDVRSCQDIDGDGVRDVIAALGDNSPVSPRVVAYAGDDGHLLWQRPVSGSIWNLTFLDDLTGDGVREIVPSQWSANLTCLNGATGAVVWSVAQPSQQRVVALDDVNGDGVDDLALGLYGTRAARVCSGLNGSTLWSTPTSDWTWAIDRVADVTGDGVNDVVAGDFDGYVYAMDGTSGTIFWSWLNPTADKIMTIRGVPDLNGNGVPDVVAGTQLLYGGTGGDVYALEGNREPTGVPDGPLAAGLRLSAGRPNPANGPITWLLAADRPGACRLLILGPDGRVVRDLGSRDPGAGASMPIVWDGRDAGGRPVSAGVYQTRVLVSGRPVAESRAVVVR
jgi:hypothetical protein